VEVSRSTGAGTLTTGAVASDIILRMKLTLIDFLPACGPIVDMAFMIANNGVSQSSVKQFLFRCMPRRKLSQS
jgi:hypothetical protein